MSIPGTSRFTEMIMEEEHVPYWDWHLIKKQVEARIKDKPEAIAFRLFVDMSRENPALILRYNRPANAVEREAEKIYQEKRRQFKYEQYLQLKKEFGE